MKVMDGTITSSFIPTPTNLNEICKADVPFIQATAYFAPVYFTIFFSKHRLSYSVLN